MAGSMAPIHYMESEGIGSDPCPPNFMIILAVAKRRRLVILDCLSSVILEGTVVGKSSEEVRHRILSPTTKCQSKWHSWYRLEEGSLIDFVFALHDGNGCVM